MAYKIDGVEVVDDTGAFVNLNASSLEARVFTQTGTGIFRRYSGSYVEIHNGKPRLVVVSEAYNCDNTGVKNCACNCNCQC